MPNPPKVALLVDISLVYGREVLAGIANYFHCHQRWQSVVLHDNRWTPFLDLLRSSRWDGILTRFNHPAVMKVLNKLGVPTVNLDDSFDWGLPWVGSDHEAIGRTGAAHFLERRFQHFGFCGVAGELWSAERKKGFQTAIEEHGFEVRDIELLHSPISWDNVLKELVQWVRGLPKPAAIMACNDMIALDIVNACHEAGLMVPEEVAVLGVDNEELLCEFCNPPLSSIEPDTQRIGWLAAELLDALMAGQSAPQRQTSIAPLKVITRQSTDILAMSDQLVASAVRFIRENALRGCHVSDVLKQLCVSRGALENRFQNSLGRSPKEEILRIQLGRIQQLLEETDFTLEHIAELTGFEHPEYLSVLFKRKLGQTPGEYRKRFSSRHYKQMQSRTLLG